MNTIGNNTIDKELIDNIKKVNKLGINVITDGREPSAQCLTVIIDEGVDAPVQEYFKVINDDDVVECASPFTWRMDRASFIKWAHRATSMPFSLIYKSISRVVRGMDTRSFERLRKITNLERLMTEYLAVELNTIGITFKGIAPVGLHHVVFIYGGIFHQADGLDELTIRLMNMVLHGHFIPDKCASCRWCRIKPGIGTERKCGHPINEGFLIPRDMPTGTVTENFPSVAVLKVGKERDLFTMWIPGYTRSCSDYDRRF